MLRIHCPMQVDAGLAAPESIALRHLDIRVTENLRKLVEIAAIHHVSAPANRLDAMPVSLDQIVDAFSIKWRMTLKCRTQQYSQLTHESP